MEHSRNFQKVKFWFDTGVWSEERVRNAVKMGWITAEEFEEITGSAFAG